MTVRRPDPEFVAALEALLRTRHVGSANAATGHQLLGELAEFGLTGHLRRIGEAVAELVAHGVPVCSSSVEPCGYFLAESEADRDRARREVDARIAALFRRRSAFKRATAARNQLEFGNLGDL